MTTNREFADKIIESLTNNMAAWEIGPHYAKCGNVALWISNRPYSDLTIGDYRIGTRRQRRQIRKLLDSVIWERLSKGLISKEQAEVIELRKMMDL